MAVTLFVFRRTEELGRRVGFLDVEDKLAEKLIKRGDAKPTRRRRKGIVEVAKPENGDKPKRGRPPKAKEGDAPAEEPETDPAAPAPAEEPEADPKAPTEPEAANPAAPKQEEG